MRPSEAWWQGNDALFEKLVEKEAPHDLSFHATSAVKRAARSSAKIRDGGIGFCSKGIDEGKPVFIQLEVWKKSKMIELASAEAAKLAEEAVQSLEESLKGFRSKIGNDLTSIKAASQRVQNEVNQMKASYTEVQTLLTSPEFVEAMKNAERMATALSSMGVMSSAKFSFALSTGDDVGS
jgi:hypothetical protein